MSRRHVTRATVGGSNLAPALGGCLAHSRRIVRLHDQVPARSSNESTFAWRRLASQRAAVPVCALISPLITPSDVPAFTATAAFAAPRCAVGAA